MARKTEQTKIDFAREKNLLDIRYQRYLNYFNILAIVSLTMAFTIVWASLLQEISAGLRNFALMADVLIFGAGLWLAHKELRNIVGRIEAL